MMVLNQTFFITDKIHCQGLLDWLDVYLMPVAEDLNNVVYGLKESEDPDFTFELTYQMEFKPEMAELILEMLTELYDQLPEEFDGFVSHGSYAIIHGSTSLENHLVAEIQQADMVNSMCMEEITQLKSQMAFLTDIYKKMLDEIQSTKIYNHQVMNPVSLQQLIEGICAEIEREDLLEEFVQFTVQ